MLFLIRSVICYKILFRSFNILKCCPFSNQRNQFYPIKPFSTNNLFLTFQTFTPFLSPCCISSFITISIKKLNNVLQERKKLNVPTGINAIVNFYNISKTLVYNITFGLIVIFNKTLKSRFPKNTGVEVLNALLVCRHRICLWLKYWYLESQKAVMKFVCILSTLLNTDTLSSKNALPVYRYLICLSLRYRK